MRPERKAARDKCMNMRTVSELNELLDDLNISDVDKEITRLVIVKGWSYERIGAELGYSARQVRRRMERVYIKMC